MVKKLLLFSIFLIFFLASVSAVYYDSSTDNFEFYLKKGWNLIPAVYLSECSSLVIAQYFYSPVHSSYYGQYTLNGSTVSVPENAQSWGDEIRDYYFGGGQWVYSTSDRVCETSIASNSSYDSSKTIKKGWNLVSIYPWMKGNTPQNIFSECNIRAVNAWDESTQNWMYASSSSSVYAVNENQQEITDAAIGKILAIKIGSDCELQVSAPSGLSTPPGLPV